MFTTYVVDPLIELLRWLNGAASTLPLPGVLSSYAVALILVAVLVKVVTFPLSAAQIRSTRSMQGLQPKLKKLQKEYKDDRETLAQKQMELYREHGVNPFGGCLPLIIQMPVLLGLFRAIQHLGSEMAGERFFWVADLSVPERLPWDSPAGIPVLIVLLIVSQFAYQKFLTPPTQASDPQAEAMASMTKFMPLIFAFIFIRLPAGIVLYYTAFNVVSLVQQWTLNRDATVPGQALPVPDAEAPAEAPARQEKQGSEPRKRRRRRKSGR